ncbi:hypothetical protein [Leifsonia sp. Leaf264]|uniref:hypothetical protein n=1 Tax=Leifsonia sp. Leaf264 TaxID=1736314 RepID=UPI00070162A2|nr:hypothetical protein [Leifsonia sp. Leaf264]KQO98579.1 hypothetical protein ASF30_10990 [Leifsonia sp. Leaf264]
MPSPLPAYRTDRTHLYRIRGNWTTDAGIHLSEDALLFDHLPVDQLGPDDNVVVKIDVTNSGRPRFDWNAPDKSWLGRTRDAVATKIAMFAYRFIATQFYRENVTAALTFGLKDARADYEKSIPKVSVDDLFNTKQPQP